MRQRGLFRSGLLHDKKRMKKKNKLKNHVCISRNQNKRHDKNILKNHKYRGNFLTFFGKKTNDEHGLPLVLIGDVVATVAYLDDHSIQTVEMIRLNIGALDFSAFE